jgi:hypothetical protein
MLKAFALIVGPILCGTVFFLTKAPAQAPGAYVELADGVYRLSTCVSGISSVAGVSTTAPVAPGEVRSFYLLLPDSVSAPANAQSARLYFKVVNHAEPQTDYGRTPVATTVRRLHQRVYRVTSEQALRWDPHGVTSAVYRQALSRIPSNRATTELLLELEVPAPPAGACRYAVIVGPPPTLPDIDVKWFVPPPPERHQ